jgi:hypothetical protein
VASPAPPPPRRSVGSILVDLAFLAAVLGATFWLVMRKPSNPPRPAFGAYVLDEAVDVPDGGVSRRLRVPVPSKLEIALAPADGKALRVLLGPAQPPERSPVDAPDPEHTTTWTAKAGDPPHVQVTMVPGLYVLRLEPAAGGAAGRVGLRVRSLAPE